MEYLGVIGKIDSFIEIKNADNIQEAIVVCGKAGKWHGVVKKNQFELDEVVEVYLPDSILPQIDRFEFMSKHKYRIRIQTIRGARSECLIMKNESGLTEIGKVIPGIEKYEKQLDKKLAGETLGLFPAFIPKTDEPRFQSVPGMVKLVNDVNVYVTEKADGASTTAYINDGYFGVCSRNLELRDTPRSAQWFVTKKYGIIDALSKLPYNAALQFEIIGPDIQSNPMGLKELSIRAFNLYNIDTRSYMGFEDLLSFCKDNNIPMVSVLHIGKIDTDDNALIEMARGKYQNGRNREGIVIRPVQEIMLNNSRVSFKVINPDYKD